MEFAANFKIESDCSVVTDDLVLRINHPRGLYRVRVANIPRNKYTVPFLLSLHIYFDAPKLDQAEEVADEILADCLNMLAFTTGAKFRFHRTKSIVDVYRAKAHGMASLLLWGDSIEYDDPQPFLKEQTTQSIERLLEFELPPALRRAMRWYRLGINENVPDDQFMYFWFALEIIAESQKSRDKVPDKCPHCHSPLYCELCESHPVHKPYAKQAIHSLLKIVDKECDDALIARLEKARNSLMHGETLKEIEDSLPEPHEEIVDVLGRLVWKALIFQFPHEMFDGSLSFGAPSTYLSRTMMPVFHMETIVPTGTDGDLDLDFKGITAQIEPFGPPQSARPTIMKLTPNQFERLTSLAFLQSNHQEMCRRIYDKAKPMDDGILCMVLATDFVDIKETVSRGEAGGWQDLFREILERT